MSATDQFENDVALLFFNNTNIANIGDATGVRGSTAAGSWFLSLHTADPTETGNQTSNEISYTGYARVAVARSGAGFTVTGDTAALAANVDFGQMTAGAGGTVTHFGIGTASSGVGTLKLIGTVTPNIVVANGVIPRLTTGTTVTVA